MRSAVSTSTAGSADTAWAMSEENVEIVRRVLDGFSRRDRASVEPLLHPDVEWTTVLGPLLGVATVSGGDAMLRFAFEEVPDVT